MDPHHVHWVRSFYSAVYLCNAKICNKKTSCAHLLSTKFCTLNSKWFGSYHHQTVGCIHIWNGHFVILLSTKRNLLQKVHILKFYFDKEFEDSISASGKNKKLASCSYCLIYHPNFCFYHLGCGFEYKNPQHSCQHNDKSKDNTKLSYTIHKNGTMHDFRLWQQCSQGFNCPGIWSCITGSLACDVSRQYSGLVVKSQMSTGHHHAMRHGYITSQTGFNTWLMYRTRFNCPNTVTLQLPGKLICSQKGVLPVHKTIVVPVHAMKVYGEVGI